MDHRTTNAEHAHSGEHRQRHEPSHGRQAHHGHGSPGEAPHSLGGVAFWATLHCLSGCAVGEVLGMVIGTGLGLANGTTVVVAVLLAFLFGYAFTVTPLLRSGMPLRTAAGIALGADTLSISIMEVVDNAIMFAWPGAMDAGLGDARFWIALAASLVLAAVAAYPANRWLIARERGHALVHANHRH